MKKGIEIIVVLLIIAGGVFAWNVYKQQQTIEAIPDALVGDVDIALEENEVNVETSEVRTEGVAEDALSRKESVVSTIAPQKTTETSSGKKGFVLTITSTPAGATLETENDIVVDFDQSFLMFTGYGPGKSHEGTFETLEAKINFDEVKTVTGGSLLIEAASVKTDSSGLDGHLKTEDFFDVEKYPTIEYVLKSVIFNSGSGEASAQGTLTLHGVTQDITAPVTILPNGFNTKFNLSLEQFGISYIGTNDEVTIEAQVVLQ